MWWEQNCPFILRGGWIRPPWVNSSLFSFLSTCWEQSVPQREKRKPFCAFFFFQIPFPVLSDHRQIHLNPKRHNYLSFLFHLTPCSSSTSTSSLLFTGKSACPSCPASSHRNIRLYFQKVAHCTTVNTTSQKCLIFNTTVDVRWNMKKKSCEVGIFFGVKPICKRTGNR